MGLLLSQGDNDAQGQYVFITDHRQTHMMQLGLNISVWDRACFESKVGPGTTW
ncbi:hypothetical protein H072_1608 [Dactylellina haptotyla CBS 200.50]|uniref:Uncharacterized protein n=1 Tax=Dactylellina haptotyla (strain CBS 200.50) TaxID=1284197 RepID=S8AN82_DACHA|nr:hypothetical protein H072_1608 [Dactylellina haptotyla CBS 200.50]